MHDDGGTDHNKPAAVVHLRGEIDLAAAPQLQRDLYRAIDRHPGAVVAIDLDGVTSIDATGLGTLVSALGRAVSRGGDIVLVCHAESIRAQLSQCRLDRVFDFT